MCPSSPIVQQRSYECDIQLDRRSTSLAIPLPESHIQRTESEIRLHENMAVAEYRDRCMFNRLISGIRQRQQIQYHFQSHAAVDWQQCPDRHRRHPTRSRGRESRSLSCDGPIIIQDTERTIENIISTRCNPIELDDVTISNMTWDGSVGDTIPEQTNEYNTNNANVYSTDDDWAIEGFESNPTSSRQSQDEYDDSDYHVFPMDL